MKPHLGQAEYKSSKTHSKAPAYSRVASEYYDEKLHPTCADFRNASSVFLEKLFREEHPSGKIADIGCGQSLLARFIDRDLVLIDESREMLEKNSPVFERREIDVASKKFGIAEFDWIFAVLGDPFNTQSTWLNIAMALKRGGDCIFIVPSFEWAQKFRASVNDEKPNMARFDLADGTTEYLPSFILAPGSQRNFITGADLNMVSVNHVMVRDLPSLRSSKTARYLLSNSPILDIYRAHKD